MQKIGDKRSLFTAASILIGTIVGAGFLAIPGVVSKTGFGIGVFYLIFIFLIMLLMNLILGEIILRTKGHHQLTGYALKYLGENGKRIMTFSQMFGIYAALLAYLIVISSSLNFLIVGKTGYSLAFGFAMWVFFSAIVSFKISKIRKSLGYGTLMILLMIVLMTIIRFPEVNYSNLQTFDFKNLFLPFGVILFSFLGFSAMPEVEEYLHGKEKMLRKALVLGTVIPLIIYFIFTLLIIGIYGNNIPEVATLAMGKFVIILGLLTMSNAYIAISAALQDMYSFDFSINRKKAWLFVVFVPLILFIILGIFKIESFITIISLGGVISGGITAVLILLISKKAKNHGDRKPEYTLNVPKWILFLIGIIFVFGIIYEILSVVGIF